MRTAFLKDSAMPSNDIQDILHRVDRGVAISRSELAQIADLASSGNSDNLYVVLRALGLAGSSAHRRIMERYLLYPRNPIISALALKALCLWWRLAADYRTQLIEFMHGVDWDLDGYLRLQIISITGEYLRGNKDPELLRIVLDIFSDPAEITLIRGAAYRSMLRSEGVEWRDMPSAARELDLSEDVDEGIVARVRKKIRTQVN